MAPSPYSIRCLILEPQHSDCIVWSHILILLDPLAPSDVSNEHPHLVSNFCTIECMFWDSDSARLSSVIATPIWCLILEQWNAWSRILILPDSMALSPPPSGVNFWHYRMFDLAF